MTSPPDSTRVGHDALHRPIRDIAWSDDRRPYDKRDRKRFRNAVAATLGISATVAGCLALPSADAARLADPECYTHTVTRGDTLSSIARNYDTTLDALKAMNPQLAAPSYNLIYPGDEVAIVCLGDAEPPARVELPRTEWSAIKAEPYFECVINGRRYHHCVSDERIIVALFEMGWRGEELLTMASVAFAEGAPAIDAIGDEDLADAVWASSHGPFQIRAQWAADGTGAPRDRFALWNPADPQASLEHGAWAARELFLARKGKFTDWSAFKNGSYMQFGSRMRAAAERIGAI